MVGARPLYLRGATREHFLTWLEHYDAELHARYLQAYRGRTELPKDYQSWVQDAVRRAVEEQAPGGASARSSFERWHRRRSA